jgi:hypothetical protein
LGQHALAEREPGQLAVPEPVVGQVFDVFGELGEITLGNRIRRVDRTLADLAHRVASLRSLMRP